MRWAISTPEYHHWHHASDEEDTANQTLGKRLWATANQSRANSG